MKKVLAMVLCASVIATCAGCGKNKDSVSGESDKKFDISTANDKVPNYPIGKGEDKLSVATTLYGSAAGQTVPLSEMEGYKKIEETVGVKTEVTTVNTERITLMFASDDLPDVVITNWDTIGGVFSYADKGQIYDLQGYMQKNAPNFVNLLKKNEDVIKDVVYPDGGIYLFPMLRLQDKLRVFQGFQIREDWLKKLNLKTPTTIDEYYEVLKAFKEKDPNGNGKADEIPLISDKSLSAVDALMYAWGIDSFYQENGKVKCGWMQPEYKKFLSTMAKWYKEGLIDVDYFSTDTTQFRSKALNEVSGTWYGRAAGVLGALQSQMESVNPEFSLVGVPWLSANGKKGCAFPAKYIEKVINIGGVITTQCKNPELATAWLDYAYGDEGRLLMNFGIEGKSYTMKDGVPTYTEEIMHNPKGLVMGEALAKYALPGNYAFEQDGYYYDQFMTGRQKDAIDTWIDCDMSKILPTLKYTSSELRVANNKLEQIKNYMSEMQAKIIAGEESIDKYGDIKEQLKKMGIDEMIKTMQTAYDRVKK